MQSAQAAGCFYSVLQRAKRMILSVEKLSHSYGVRTLKGAIKSVLAASTALVKARCGAISHAVKPVTAAGLRQMAAA